MATAVRGPPRNFSKSAPLTRRKGLRNLKAKQMVNIIFKLIKELSNTISHIHRFQGISLLHGMKIIQHRGSHIREICLIKNLIARSCILRASGGYPHAVGGLD